MPCTTPWIRTAAAVLCSILVLICVTAHAQAVLPGLMLTFGYEDSGYHEVDLDSAFYGTVYDNGDGTYEWTGTYSVSGICDMEWDLTLDPDPFIAGNVSLVNNTGVTSTFLMQTTLPTAAFPSGLPMSGSSTISVGDSDQSANATLSAPLIPAGSSIYSALIDGAVQRQLFPAPYSLSTPPIAGLTVGDTQFFLGEFTTLPITTEIGIRHHFRLTAGDTATMNSTFNVVPEPASVTLVLVGTLGLCLYRVRRRRHA